MAKSQRHQHEVWVENVGPTGLIVDTEFGVKFQHLAAQVLNSAQHRSTTMMVMFVHHSPRRSSSGRRVLFDAYTFAIASSDHKLEFDFHRVGNHTHPVPPNLRE